MLERCLGQQPFKAAVAKVSARQRFENICNAYTCQSQNKRLRYIGHQGRTRRFHRYQFVPVDQFPIENRTGHDVPYSNTVVLMQIGDRLRRPSGIEIIPRRDQNKLQWPSQPGRDHVLLDEPSNSDAGVEALSNNVH